MTTKPQRRASPRVGSFSAMLIGRLAQKTRFVDPGLAARWPEIVGGATADLCRPGRLSGGKKDRTLEVYVRDGAAAHEISFHEAAVIEKLNGFFGPGVIGRLTIKQADGGDAPSAPSGGLGRFLSGN